MSRLGPAGYSHTLDELFGSAAPSLRPRLPKAEAKTPVIFAERPTTRHGRSSESSSSSNRTENLPPKVGEKTQLSPASVDVWTRIDQMNEPAELLQALGSKRRNITESPIMEHDLSEVTSGSSSSDSDNEVKPFEKNRSLQTTESSKPTTTESIKPPSIGGSTGSSHSSQSTANNLINVDDRPSTFTKDQETRSRATSEDLKDTSDVEATIVKPTANGSLRTLTKPRRPSADSDSRRTQLAKGAERSSTEGKASRTAQKLLNTSVKRQPRSKTAVARSNSFGPKQRSSSTATKSTVEHMLANSSETYKLWLRRKLEEDKRKKMVERERQEEEERKQKEKKENAEKAFKRWQEENERRLTEQRKRQRKLEEEKRKQTEEDAKKKKVNAEKTFQTWRKRQDEKLRTERVNQAQKERLRSQSAQEQKRRQKEEGRNAYYKWVEQMNERQRELKQQTLEKELMLKKQVDEEKQFRDALANEAYEIWLEMKKKESLFSHSLAYKIMDFETEGKKRWSNPWIPTGNTVPRKFVGTGHRRRTLEKPLSIVQNRAKSVN